MQLPVSEALLLKAALARLLQQIEDSGARNPDERETRRETMAAVASFLDRLGEGLRAYDVPAAPNSEERSV